MNKYATEFHATTNVLLQQFGYDEHPSEIKEHLEQIRSLKDELSRTPVNGPIEIHETVLPLLKRVLLARRRTIAEEVQTRKSEAIHTEVITMLEARKAPLDKMLSSSVMEKVLAIHVPTLSDYLSIRRLNELEPGAYPTNRFFDEKFRILQAFSQFFPDLASYRRQCELRSISLVVAFLDIDNFKEFNTKYSEARVDQDILPRFMQVLEAQVFSHGYAYRYGGDEYIILLPNCSRSTAATF